MTCKRRALLIFAVFITLKVILGTIGGIMLYNANDFISNEENHLKRTVQINCNRSSDCGDHATCEQDGPNYYICKCASGWVDRDGGLCNYQQKEKLTAFLVSFFVGELAVDWFYLASGNCCYNCAGATKLLTCGWFLIGWLIDWIRILADAFPDGNGVPLKSW